MSQLYHNYFKKFKMVTKELIKFQCFLTKYSKLISKNEKVQKFVYFV